ncbi:hypothetical protein HY792_05760 [Candidatus Desantisbacteria bacterium]|nr:hypothetical protein [Candidatus Desantisbacteria bacterium]
MKNKSINQFAYVDGDGILINKKQRLLFLSKYRSNAIPVVKILDSQLLYPVRIKGVFIQLNEFNEKDFFKETEFGGLWSIIYTGKMTAEQVIKLINDDAVLTHFPSYVYATLRKEFEDEHGTSFTAITTKEPFEGDKGRGNRE